MDGTITITPSEADPDSSKLEVLRSSLCLAGITVIFPAIPGDASIDHPAVRFRRDFGLRSVQSERLREPVQAWRTLRWSLGTAAAACKSRCVGIHCHARQPIGLPPRQGDTGSDHLDPRDALCVPVFFCLAWVDNYDIAVLVSSDRDFVPVAEFLETRGIKVIHGAFPPKGAQLTARCWANIDIARLREDFRFSPRISRQGVINTSIT